MSLDPWRKRCFSSLSKRTSTTSFGLSGVSSSSPVPQRFGSLKRRSLFLSISGNTLGGISARFFVSTGAGPDGVEMPVVGIEAEQERRDRVAAALLPADPGHDAVRGLVRLDLDDA